MAWDPKAYAEENKRSTSPVSAFFMIDSFEAIRKCVEELGRLGKYGMPDMRESTYFSEIARIFGSGRTVRNFDQDVTFHWEGQDIPGVIRAHSLDAGLEIEVWIPGVIAADAAGMFKDGREGFFCAYMPPSFYD